MWSRCAAYRNLSFMNWSESWRCSTHLLTDEWSPQESQRNRTKKKTTDGSICWNINSLAPTNDMLISFMSIFPFLSPPTLNASPFSFFFTPPPVGILMPVCICVRRPSACCPLTPWSGWLVRSCCIPTSSPCCCSVACWWWAHCRTWGRWWQDRKCRPTLDPAGVGGAIWYLANISRNLCLYVFGSRTVHPLAFTLFLCFVKGPKKCSVKFGAIWKHDTFSFDKIQITRWPFSSSVRGSFQSRHQLIFQFRVLSRASLIFELTGEQHLQACVLSPAADLTYHSSITAGCFYSVRKSLQPALTQAKKTDLSKQADLEQALH